MDLILRHERRVCPPEYQKELTERFGLNRFDEPNFRIVWGQTETTTVAGLRGYEPRLLCNGLPCWNILRWIPPESYGTPEMWYRQNFDELTGLCLMGPYPDKGRYEVAIPLMNKKMVNGNLQIEAMPLCYAIIDTIIPLLVKAQRLTYWERKAAEEQREAKENAAIVSEITDRLLDDMPTFYGPTSYREQQNRTALIDRKMAEIERVWKMLPRNYLRNPRLGLHQN
jgi:hypothetical protein